MTGVEARQGPASPVSDEPAGPDARITVAGAAVALRPSGALFWPDRALLCIADLHLGRAERLARAGGELLPPYETQDTLDRLEAEIVSLAPHHVVCLGDSFDDLVAAHNLAGDLTARISRMAAGRRWTWIAGNHDPGPVELPGSHLAELRLGLLSFRHQALKRIAPGSGEVSAHFHPKALLTRRGVRLSRPCFLADAFRIVLPAFGTYTGGLSARDAAFDALLGPGARAYLTGERVAAVARDRLD